jgi:hypothetical protein
VPKIVYIGPFDEVDVPAYRLRATPEQPVEVSDEAAADLLAQTENWKAVGSDPARTPASTPAPGKAAPANDADASTPQED